MQRVTILDSCFQVELLSAADLLNRNAVMSRDDFSRSGISKLTSPLLRSPAQRKWICYYSFSVDKKHYEILKLQKHRKLIVNASAYVEPAIIYHKNTNTCANSIVRTL